MASTGMKTHMPLINMWLEIAKNGYMHAMPKKAAGSCMALHFVSSLARVSGLVKLSWSCGISVLGHWLLLCNAGTVVSVPVPVIGCFPGQAGELPALEMLQRWQLFRLASSILVEAS